MRRFVLPIAAVLLAGLAACGPSDKPKPVDNGKASTTASKPLDAASAFTQLSGKVASAKLSGTVTAANDPNHLLGRPNQYTSKTTFTDSRIAAADVSGTQPGDVDRGGAIEVFADPAGAKARAAYIQSIAKAMPAVAEYDYVHGTVVVRVSHYLTPAQTAAYKTAVDGLG
ncbi:hypothetical protein OG762_12825 [Streptomyces sp. NBC_01136]|uniref:hypothetical protein n=1 Tax=unclassified Streptomyces TaxID=2593676 RepID=UPI003249D260|nr:hypothetical protein OG762_12825 [Streptomyces sp. NBC_01136]